MKKPILCLDFDGVLHSYESGWQGARNIPDPAVPNAMQFIDEAMNHFEVCIFSSRSHQWGGRRAMKRWVQDRMEEYIANTHPEVLGMVDPLCEDRTVIEALAESVIYSIRFPIFKPAATISIDDRAITFMGRWPSMEELLNFKPWNKKGV